MCVLFSEKEKEKEKERKNKNESDRPTRERENCVRYVVGEDGLGGACVGLKNLTSSLFFFFFFIFFFYWAGLLHYQSISKAY